jgi:hypothetical protein
MRDPGLQYAGHQMSKPLNCKIARRALLGGAVGSAMGVLLPGRPSRPLEIPRPAAASRDFSERTVGIATEGQAARPSEQLFSLAQSSLANVTETHYSYSIHIDPSLGVYDTDCSGFVDYLLRHAAPAAYVLIPKERGFAHPRAYMLEQFFGQLDSGAQGWAAVTTTPELQAGDILAWAVPVEQNKDTGHCMVVAGLASVLPSGAFSVPVIDASELRHYNDSRPRGTTGLGSGSIHLQVDETGSPIAFQFDAGESFHQAPISAGRLV